MYEGHQLYIKDIERFYVLIATVRSDRVRNISRETYGSVITSNGWKPLQRKSLLRI